MELLAIIFKIFLYLLTVQASVVTPIGACAASLRLKWPPNLILSAYQCGFKLLSHVSMKTDLIKQDMHANASLALSLFLFFLSLSLLSLFFSLSSSSLFPFLTLSVSLFRSHSHSLSPCTQWCLHTCVFPLLLNICIHTYMSVALSVPQKTLVWHRA